MFPRTGRTIFCLAGGASLQILSPGLQGPVTCAPKTGGEARTNLRSLIASSLNAARAPVVDSRALLLLHAAPLSAAIKEPPPTTESAAAASTAVAEALPQAKRRQEYKRPAEDDLRSLWERLDHGSPPHARSPPLALPIRRLCPLPSPLQPRSARLARAQPLAIAGGT